MSLHDFLGLPVVVDENLPPGYPWLLVGPDKIVAPPRPPENRWLVVCAPQLEDRVRAAMEENGIPPDLLRVSTLVPPDHVYKIDVDRIEDIPDEPFIKWRDP